MIMKQFTLDLRLEADSFPLTRLGLCELRLLNDKRWPWLILIPQRPDLVELTDMTPLDQALLTFESGLVSTALKNITGCLKINTGALGNVVRQLHCHVVARNENDPGWPGPVWGHGTRIVYEPQEAQALIEKILKAL